MRKTKSENGERKINSVSFMLGELSTEIKNLQVHFTNHLHTHKWDKILSAIYFLCVIIMFCWLRWAR